jgi:uncharacterized protein YdeI (YjbR/CyaY-like superfamily)
VHYTLSCAEFLSVSKAMTTTQTQTHRVVVTIHDRVITALHSCEADRRLAQILMPAYEDYDNLQVLQLSLLQHTTNTATTRTPNAQSTYLTMLY